MIWEALEVSCTLTHSHTRKPPDLRKAPPIPARIPAGLKRYFHAKRGEGLLSAQGLRILDYACDRAIDQAQAPLVSSSHTLRACTALCRTGQDQP